MSLLTLVQAFARCVPRANSGTEAVGLPGTLGAAARSYAPGGVGAHLWLARTPADSTEYGLPGGMLTREGIENLPSSLGYRISRDRRAVPELL